MQLMPPRQIGGPSKIFCQARGSERHSLCGPHRFWRSLKAAVGLARHFTDPLHKGNKATWRPSSIFNVLDDGSCSGKRDFQSGGFFPLLPLRCQASFYIPSWKTAVLCTNGHAKQHLLDRDRTGIAISPSLQSVLSGAFTTSLQKGSIAYRLALCSRAPLSSWLASHLVVFSWPARAGVFQMNSLALPSGISRSIDVVRATNTVFVTAYQRLFVTGDCDLAIVALFASVGVSGSADLR